MRKYLVATLFLVLFVLTMGPVGESLSRLLLQEEPTFHTIQEGEWLSRISKRYYGDISYWRELELINRAPDGDDIYPGEEIIIPSFEVVEKIRSARRLSRVNELIHEQQAILADRRSETPSDLSSQEMEVTDASQTEAEEDFETVTAHSDDAGNSERQPAGEEELTRPADSGAESEELSGLESAQDSYLETPEMAEFEDSAEEIDDTPMLSTAMIVGILGVVAAFIIGIVVYVRRKNREEVTVYGGDESPDDSGRGLTFRRASSHEPDFEDQDQEDDDLKVASPNGASKQREPA